MKLNTWRLRQNGHHFPEDISNAFSWMKMHEFRVRLHWSLFPRAQLTIFQHLVQIMAWRRPDDKTLSEPMMVSLLTHICVTRPQWVKPYNHIYAQLFSIQTIYLWSVTMYNITRQWYQISRYDHQTIQSTSLPLLAIWYTSTLLKWAEEIIEYFI